MKYSIIFLLLGALFLTNCSYDERSYLEKKADEYSCLDLANNVDGPHGDENTWTDADFVVIDSRIKGPYMVFSEGYNSVALRNYGSHERYSFERFEAYLEESELLMGR